MSDMKKKKSGKASKADLAKMSKEELFTRLNGSAGRTLEALQQAYEAGMKAGISDDEEDQVIELLRRAKKLRDEVKRITSEKDSNPPQKN